MPWLGVVFECLLSQPRFWLSPYFPATGVPSVLSLFFGFLPFRNRYAAFGFCRCGSRVFWCLYLWLRVCDIAVVVRPRVSVGGVAWGCCVAALTGVCCGWLFEVPMLLVIAGFAVGVFALLSPCSLGATCVLVVSELLQLGCLARRTPTRRWGWLRPDPDGS